MYASLANKSILFSVCQQNINSEYMLRKQSWIKLLVLTQKSILQFHSMVVIKKYSFIHSVWMKCIMSVMKYINIYVKDLCNTFVSLALNFDGFRANQMCIYSMWTLEIKYCRWKISKTKPVDSQNLPFHKPLPSNHNNWMWTTPLPLRI